MQIARGKSNIGKSNIEASNLSSFLLKKSLYQFSQPQKYRTAVLRQLKRSRKTARIKPDSETWGLRRQSVKLPWLQASFLSHSTLLLLKNYLIFTKAIQRHLYTSSQTEETQVCNSSARISRINPDKTTVQN